MPISINGTGSITGLSAGGLPDNSIVTADIADSAVTSAKMASGAARSNFGAGAVLQVVSTTKTDVFSTTSTSFTDVTGLSATITPSSTSSRILVMCSVNGSVSSSSFQSGLRLLRDATAISIGDAAGSRSRGFGQLTSANTWQMASAYATFLDSPSTTSSVTYKIQCYVQSGQTLNINQNSDNVDNSQTLRGVSSITLMEIAG